MRQIIKLGFILGLVASNNAFSTDRVEGLYFGLLAQLSHPSSQDLNFTINGITSLGTIQLQPIGGGMGASLGWRIRNFRVEAETLFNFNNYGSMQVGSCKLISPQVLGPEGVCDPFFVETGLGFKGYTIGVYEFINGFYDFISSDPDKNFFPYIGVGIGGAYLSNTAIFHSNSQCISLNTCSPIIDNANFSSSTTGFAAQGILGFNYFLDDFTSIGLDVRYSSTFNFNKNNNTTTPTSNNSASNFGIATINLTGNFALAKAD